MKRSALLFGALMVGAASGANAQALTMQMSNGWTFGFAGNVNIFAQYQSQSKSGNTPAGLVGIGGKGFYYGTGLLPSFATFTAKGKEGNTDLGVQFGFAPQVQCGGGNHDCFGGEFSGAQIDMRQVFMTVGGSWGSIVAGRELGVYQRQNILNNRFALQVAEQHLQLGGVVFQGQTVFTKQQVMALFEVSDATVERYVSNHGEELKVNGYQLLRGKNLNEFKDLVGGTLINECIITVSLGAFSFRAVLNMSMLLTES